MSRPQALVVCIGNELVADDAVGYQVYQRLQTLELPSATRLEYCGVGGVALLELLREEDQQLIVVDALQLGAPAGTVHCLAWDQLPPQQSAAVSAHGIGLREALAIGRLLYPERLPERVLLIGIEGCSFDQLGGAMTPAVAAALPLVVTAVQRALDQQEWKGVAP